MKLFELFKFPLTLTYTKVHDQAGQIVIDIRGWGMLTGKGAMGMKEDDAIELQDTYGQEIVDILNEAYEKHTFTYEYKDYTIRGFSDGLFDIDENGQLVDGGFDSVEECKQYIDDLVT